MKFLVSCSSGAGLSLAPTQDILRVEQVLFHSQGADLQWGEKDRRQAEGPWVLGKWKEE